MSSRGLSHWFDRFIPAALHIPPQEWFRAALGALLALMVAASACRYLFGSAATLHLMAPLAASSVLLFAVHSGALSQPWPFLASYVCAAAVGISLHHWFGPGLFVASAALLLVILLMCLLRCLHPPGAALAVSLALADPSLAAMGVKVIEPVMLNALIVLAIAIGYNRLTGVLYPRIGVPRKVAHATADQPASERVGISRGDLDQALDELGGFIDVTRPELERIILATERHAVQRSLGGITAAHVMSRDVQIATPQTTLQQAWKQLSGHHLKSLPVLDKAGKLVGIVSLGDLVGPAMAQARFSWRGLFGRGKPATLAQIMSKPVITVDSDHQAVELIPLLCDRGLHCLPVLEAGNVVGVVTQTDLIAALSQHLLAQDRLAKAA